MKWGGSTLKKFYLMKKSGLADKIKFDYINQASWNITDTLNITIGQGAKLLYSNTNGQLCGHSFQWRL